MPAAQTPTTPRGQKAVPTSTIDPNAGRSSTYLNTWTAVVGKNTAKCDICRHTLKGIKYCIECDTCYKIICQPCWDGESKDNDELWTEGKAQNKDGCWCWRDDIPTFQWKPRIDARAKRILARQAVAKRANEEGDGASAEQDGESHGSSDTPLAKRLKMMDRSSEESTEAAGEDDGAHESDDTGPTKNLDAQNQHDTMPEFAPITHLEDITTVIIGAGVIGLSITRALAVDAHVSGTHHKIVVVEANETYASHASGACAGWITRRGMDAELAPPHELSIEAWAESLVWTALLRKPPTSHTASLT